MNLNNSDRFSFFPIESYELHNLYEEMLSVQWIPSEVENPTDRDDWDSLHPNVQHFIKNILFLFAQLDGVINENIEVNFMEETSFIKDATHFYTIQIANELVHNNVYGNLIETFIRDPEEKKKGMDSIKYIPSIRKISEWASTWMEREKTLQERVLAFACIEGIIFSSAFAGIYYLKRLPEEVKNANTNLSDYVKSLIPQSNQQILNGLLTANEWISRDEGIHTRFAITLYNVLIKQYNYKPLTKEQAYSIVQSAYNVCEEFTRFSMNTHLIGINVNDMMDYVSVTADWVLNKFGFESLFNRTNPLTWMDSISLMGKSNFFEKTVTEYSRPVDAGVDYKKTEEYF